MTLILKLAAVLTVAAVAAPAAQAHHKFTDGPRTARQIAAAWNKTADIHNATCRYRRPHILCTGLVKHKPRSDVYYRFRATVHKTAPRRGYAMVCLVAFGICERQTVRFRV